MEWSRRFAAVAVAMLATGLTSCGGEAESREEPRSESARVKAFDALREEVVALRTEVTALRTWLAAEPTQPAVPGRIALELRDAGPVDPYLAERAPEMAYIAAKWDQDSFKPGIEQNLELLQKRGHAAIAGIVPFLRDTSSDARLAALYVLREMGVAAESAVPYIKERARDPDPAVCAAARDALCAIHGR